MAAPLGTLTRAGQRLLGSELLAALTSPHDVDRYLEQLNPMWTAREVRARIVEIRPETDGSDGSAPVSTIVLAPTHTWRGHRAGQHVQVGVELPDLAKRLTRCFTISSPASAPGEQIMLTVRAHEDAAGRPSVSGYLVRQAKVGQIVHLSQAQGAFTLSESPATPTNNRLLFITGGSGITPAMSMLRTLLRDGYDGHVGRKVTFLHYARSKADQIFAEELAAIAAADNGVDVHLRYGEHRFNEFELRRLVPDFRDVDSRVCGPAGLMELVSAAYAGSPRLRTEFFKVASVPAADSAEGTVSFELSGQSAANTGQSLLEQAEALGLTPEFGCRMGICFTCTTRKSAGTVRNICTGAESSLPDEDIQICVSAPVGDCVVEL